jgi:hypothetical protein
MEEPPPSESEEKTLHRGQIVTLSRILRMPDRPFKAHGKNSTHRVEPAKELAGQGRVAYPESAKSTSSRGRQVPNHRSVGPPKTPERLDAMVALAVVKAFGNGAFDAFRPYTDRGRHCWRRRIPHHEPWCPRRVEVIVKWIYNCYRVIGTCGRVDRVGPMLVPLTV